jgi:hypothetical protein
VNEQLYGPNDSRTKRDRELLEQWRSNVVDQSAESRGDLTAKQWSSAATLSSKMSAQECESRRWAVTATSIPDNASITASQETVMFMMKTILDMIDSSCTAEPGVTPTQIAAERQLRKQQFAAAESACNAVQSGGRSCVARNHFGPGTETNSTTNSISADAKPAPPIRDFDCAPDPDNTLRSKDRYKVVAYDPVTGRPRCVNEPESMPQKQNGRRQTNSDWETSPGIRK